MSEFSPPGQNPPELRFPEYINRTPQEDTLARELSLNEDEVRRIAPQIEATVDRALTTALNPHDRESVLVAAQFIRWHTLGQPGDPLPEGFSLVRTLNPGNPASEKSLSWQYDGSDSISADCISMGIQQLKAAGLTNVEAEVKNILHTPDLIRQYLETQPAYQLMQSFNVQPPQSAEQPLTPFRRAMREAQIEQAVRHDFALGNWEPIIRHSPADSQLRRQSWQLDDETMLRPDTAPRDLDALERARKYPQVF